MRRWMLILCFIRSTSDFNLFWIVWWWSLTFVWKTDFSLNWIGIWSFCFKLCKITCNYNLCGFSVSPNCIFLFFFKWILRGFRIQFTYTITQLISTKSTPEKLCRSCKFCVQKRYKKEQFRKASKLYDFETMKLIGLDVQLCKLFVCCSGDGPSCDGNLLIGLATS